MPSAVNALRGLSPRVRGSRNEMVYRRYRTRSIPACAGEPCGTTPVPTPIWVYPRVCGGALTWPSTML